MKEKVKIFWNKNKAIIYCGFGIALGVGGMLIYRRYEYDRIGKGIAKMVLDPEILAKTQKMAKVIVTKF